MKTAPQAWENVYIFISSTFNDMHAERDYLVKRVFPELSAWCEERRLRLVDIDLRWGVTEKDSEQNKRVVDVCLANIDRCRPLFLCFLGQRYGWVPGESDIAADTFENFPKLRQHLGASVTEMEIVHAAIDPMLNGSVMELKNRERAFFFFRAPDYLPSITDRNVRNVYTNEGEADPAKADRKLADLKHRLRDESGRPTFDYTAAWDCTSRTPELQSPDKPDGIDVGRLVGFECGGNPLSQTVTEALKNAIAELYPSHTVADSLTPLQLELDEQERFVQSAQEGFIERAGDFDQIFDYIDGDDTRPCALCAPAGIGKTSLMARLVSKLQDQRTHNVLYRFVGNSSDSVSLGTMLPSIAQELRDRYDVKDVPTDLQKIRDSLPELLAKAASEKPLVVIIDALNQLDSGLDDLAWLPIVLPGNVKFIYSFKLGDSAGDSLLQSISADGKTRIIQIRPFEGLEDRRAIVEQYLSQYLKQLDEDREEAIIGAQGADNPLFLKVLLSELKVFGSHEALGSLIATQFGHSPTEAFDGMLARLENDPVYSTIPPRTLVSNLMGWMAHARNGLQPDELASLLLQEGLAQSMEEALDSVNLVLRQIRPFLAKRDKRADFFYESFLIAAQTRYTDPSHGGKPSQMWHDDLFRMFHARPQHDQRRLSEEAYQAAYAGQSQHLKQMLTSYEYLQEKADRGYLQPLIQEYRLVSVPQTGITDEEIVDFELIHDALEMSVPTLNLYSDQLPTQLYARLLGFERTHVKKLLDDVLSYRETHDMPWIRPLVASMAQPGSNLERSFLVDRDCVCVFADKRRLLIHSSTDASVRLIEIETGRTLRNYPGFHNPDWIFLFEDLGIFAVRDGRKLRLVNLDTGKETLGDVQECAGRRLLYDGFNGMLVSATSQMVKPARVFVNDVQSGKLLHVFDVEEQGPNTLVAKFDHDTGYLLLTNEAQGTTAYDPANDFAVVRRFVGEPVTGQIRSRGNKILIPQGQRFFITMTEYDGLTIWDKSTGDILMNTRVYGASFSCIALSPDNKTLAQSSYAELYLYTMESFERTATITIGNSTNRPSSLTFSNDSSQIFVGHSNGDIELWDLGSQSIVTSLVTSNDPPLQMQLISQDRKLLSLCRSRVDVWDMNKSTVNANRGVLDLKVHGFAVSPDGSFVIVSTTSDDGSIYRIDIPSMACRKLVEPSGSFYTLFDTIISCDGRYFAVLERLKTLKMYSTETGEPVAQLDAIDVDNIGDKDAVKIASVRFLPRDLWLGQRGLTVIYRQNGSFIIDDPDAPDKRRIIKAFPGGIGWNSLIDDGTKIAAFSSIQVFDPTMTGYKYREDPSLKDGCRVFDLKTGDCLEHTEDWADLYLRSSGIDVYPAIAGAIRTRCGGISKNSYTPPAGGLVFTDKGNVLYMSSPHNRSVVVQNAKTGTELCRFVYERGTATFPDVPVKGNIVTLNTLNSLFPLRFENVDIPQNDDKAGLPSAAANQQSQVSTDIPAAEEKTLSPEEFEKLSKEYRAQIKQAREADQWDKVKQMLPTYYDLVMRYAPKSLYDLDALAFNYSRIFEIESLERAEALYRRLMQLFPENEMQRKNYGITRRTLADTYFKEGSAAQDPDLVRKGYERYREQMELNPGNEKYRKNWLSHGLKLVYLLSQKEDVASLEEACALYDRLLVEDPENQERIKNRDITRRRLARFLSAQLDQPTQN